jgi:hypothetical protein
MQLDQSRRRLNNQYLLVGSLQFLLQFKNNILQEREKKTNIETKFN